MNKQIRIGLISAGLGVAGVVSHLVPHDMGVSTVGAISMLAAAYLPRSLVMIPVMLTVLVVDAINGFYAILAMSFVYLAYLVAALGITPLLKSVGTRNVLFAAVLNAVMFYLISNISQVALGFYSATLQGWLLCYYNGLPFLLKGILANIIFGGAAFLIIRIVGDIIAHRFPAAERH